MRSYSKVCVDANILVNGLRAAGVANSALSELWQSFHANGTVFCEPKLFNTEITSVFRRLEFDREITSDETPRFLRLAFSLPIEYLEEYSLHFEALDIARAFQVRAAYDAHYVAVARRAGVPLITSDRRLANAAGQFVEVQYIPTVPAP